MADRLVEFLANFDTLIRSAGVVMAATVVMAVLQRVLQRGSDTASGRRFRNQLVMFTASLVVMLLVIVALPLDTQTRGQLLGLFGIVLSATIALSSSTFLGNAMAGIMLKTVRNFRSGDFLTVGEHFGRVSERGLFHTEIQTPDRDLTTIPNLYLATTPVTVVRGSGTVVSATCSLGYDVHHSRIEDLLLEAAEEAGLAEPFVQVLELGDHSVTYKVAGLLEEVKSLLATRSRLRQAMLDCLHRGGVEIVSPLFRNVRAFDSERAFIPARSPRGAEQATDTAPEEVIFDKAEVAENLAGLQEQREELSRQLKEARQAVKDAESEQSANRARRHADLLEGRLERLDESIDRSRQEADDEQKP